MERSYTVYMHVNKINGKVYVGITVLLPEIRWGKNGSNYKQSPYFWYAIQKYEWENFDHVILAQGQTKENAASEERRLIAEKKAKDPRFGYNLASGGYSQPGEDNPFFGHTHSEEVKKAISERNRHRVWTEESKQKCREKQLGEKSPRAKAVLCVETGEIYQTIKIAAEAMNVTPGKICDVLKGRHKTCAGYHWQYSERKA